MTLTGWWTYLIIITTFTPSSRVLSRLSVCRAVTATTGCDVRRTIRHWEWIAIVTISRLKKLCTVSVTIMVSYITICAKTLLRLHDRDWTSLANRLHDRQYDDEWQAFSARFSPTGWRTLYRHVTRVSGGVNGTSRFTNTDSLTRKVSELGSRFGLLLTRQANHTLIYDHVRELT